MKSSEYKKSVQAIVSCQDKDEAIMECKGVFIEEPGTMKKTLVKPETNPYRELFLGKSSAPQIMKVHRAQLNDQDGHAYGAVNISRDVTAIKKIVEKQHDSSNIMGHIARIATKFINLKVEDIDKSIAEAIKEIGTLLKVNRVCTYLFDIEGSGFFRLLQWNADGAVPDNMTLKTLSKSRFPGLMGRISNREVVVINKLSDLPDGGDDTWKMMDDQGIISALIIPLVWSEIVDGFFCIEAISEIHEWNNDEITAFELLASSVAGALKYKISETALMKSKEDLRILNESLESQIMDRTRSLEESMDILKKSQEIIIQQEKLSSIGQLAAGMAHEINNPTGYIMSNLYIFKDYLDQLLHIISEYDSLNGKTGDMEVLVKEVISKVKSIKQDIDFDYIRKDAPELLLESLQGTDRIKEIVIALQGYARSSASDKEPVSIEDLLDRAVKLSWNELKYKCEIIKDFDNVPIVLARENQLLQVFINLLLNASQAIQEKGSITIMTRKKNRAIIISIEDTGTGILPKDLPKILDPFYTTKPVGQGTGLGLSISQSIIAEHDGSIEVGSEVGVGTTFTITLPIAENLVSAI